MQDGEIFEHKGVLFIVSIERDELSRAPWEECEGHGVVTKWERRGPERGEWVLSGDRYSHRFYNWRETLEIAKRDGWGLHPDCIAELALKLKRQPTQRDIRKEAVRRDYEYLRGWCNDEWEYLCIGVRMVGGTETQYLGGVDGSDAAYIVECARDLAGELLHPMHDEKDRCIMELGA
jgi:hypothetical protein